MTPCEEVAGMLVSKPAGAYHPRDVVRPDTGEVVGVIRRDHLHGQLWRVRVSGIPWRKDAAGRVPYHGAARSKARAVAVILDARAATP